MYKKVDAFYLLIVMRWAYIYQFPIDFYVYLPYGSFIFFFDFVVVVITEIISCVDSSRYNQ